MPFNYDKTNVSVSERTRAIDAGLGFIFSIPNVSIPAATTVYYRIVVPSTVTAKLDPALYSIGPGSLLVSFILGADIVTPGALQMPTYNLNGNSTKAAGLKIYAGTDGVSGGVAVDYAYFNTTVGFSGNGLYGTEGISMELTRGSTFVGSLQNTSTTTALQFSSKLVWFEYPLA